MKQARILFFVLGVAPTAEDFEAAAKLQADVVFRNARAVPSEGSLEACDGVAGEVPERYAEKYPPAEEAIKKYKEALKAMHKKAGDAKPPKEPEAPQLQPQQPAAPVAPVIPDWTGQQPAKS
jgi:hypothetical protein